jgi:hypothetical protein
VTSAERAALQDWLDFHRATLLVKCAGLTAEQLKARPLLPSRLSLLGLVRHLTEVEQWWFRMVAAGLDGEEFPYSGEGREQADLEDVDEAHPEADLERYRQACAAADAAARSLDLDAVVTTPGRPGRDRNVRWIYLHMIEEYARHNGHADLIREHVDGVTGA